VFWRRYGPEVGREGHNTAKVGNQTRAGSAFGQVCGEGVARLRVEQTVEVQTCLVVTVVTVTHDAPPG